MAGNGAAERRHLAQRYVGAVAQLRDVASARYGIQAKRFDDYVLYEFFRKQRNTRPPAATMVLFGRLGLAVVRRRQICCWLLYMSLASACVMAWRYEGGGGGGKVDDSNEGQVSPSTRIWRHLTMPLIRRFPWLTELYDEPCLMGNPFYEQTDLDCSTCAHIERVWNDEHDDEMGNENTCNFDAGGSNSVAGQQCLLVKHRTVPFVFRSKRRPDALLEFQRIYHNHLKVFQRDAFRVHSTNDNVRNLEQMFGQFNSTAAVLQAHNIWRCNRMAPARLIRPVFARPNRLPSVSVALERFVAVDMERAAAYSLPETICPNVFVHQTAGSRLIILRPSSQCRQYCRTITMRLTPSLVLNYNGLQWKPISAADPMTDAPSISLIGSYC